ncbi:hypothetical protein [Cytobacillus firmus]|uniref:hypothetical protein n=1 Tax=Cytobacillus firmus TaxID=1399 RepID=UPI0018CE8C14|nr:hypothetical protein [Cytobacillus firmus]MBG9548324.1 hypothetical protein [Cytobacillus firmus]MBG9600826.1 hypothetical protein [Cytobacillus firmus]MED1938911.1 hypothetical protein [Cytobacillus firmus]
MTVGEMLILTERLSEITSSKLPASIKNDRLENLMLDIEDAFVNDEYATQLYSAVYEAKIDPCCNTGL